MLYPTNTSWDYKPVHQYILEPLFFKKCIKDSPVPSLDVIDVYKAMF